MGATIKEVMALFDQLTEKKSREAAAVYSEQMANGWDEGYARGYAAGAAKAEAEKKEAG